MLSFDGSWQGLPVRKKLAEELFGLTKVEGLRHLTVDMGAVTGWDSLFAAMLCRLREWCGGRDIAVEMKGVPSGLSRLMRLSSASPLHHATAENSTTFLERIGTGGMNAWEQFLQVCAFLGELFFALMRLLRFRSRMRWCDFLTELRKCGPSALGINLLVGFLIGLIWAFIGALLLRRFSAEEYVATMIGLGVCRLMGAVMTGTVMAGRTGTAFAAELGAMKVNEETDALESMGIPLMDFCVLPRMLALTIMMPFLCIYSDLAGIFGGMVVSALYADISPKSYWEQLCNTTEVQQVLIGLFTSFVFGILISLCGCMKGLQCSRSSSGVGQATTSAVVASILCMTVSTAIITVITVAFGL